MTGEFSPHELRMKYKDEQASYSNFVICVSDENFYCNHVEHNIRITTICQADWCFLLKSLFSVGITITKTKKTENHMYNLQRYLFTNESLKRSVFTLAKM